MLISEIKGWHWAITWDNPKPANSSSMKAALRKLGNLTAVGTKTTYILAPKANTSWQDIRKAIVQNLHPAKGNAFYVNMRTTRTFEYGPKTKFRWRSVV